MNTRQTLRGSLMATLCLVSACGGGGSPAAPSASAKTPPPPTPVVVLQNSGTVPADTFGYIEFNVPGAGTLAATVDWTFPSSLIWIAVTTDACDSEDGRVFLGGCPTIGSPSLFPGGKPKTVTGPVAQAGRVRLWVANLAEVDESIAVQVTHTRVASATAGVGADAVVSFAAPAGPWVFRKLPAQR